ncbi:ATP-dependent DNA helicase [Trichonephila clavipes]|nr:ATP-dependent DNA helicase [Trichonephila clavipes]
MGDKEAQVNRRSEYVQGVERNTVQKIQQVLHNHNIFVHEFKMAKDRVTRDNALIHIEDKIIRISGKKLSDFDTQVSKTEPRLLPEQKDIYNKILQRVELAKIRKDRNVALAVASSGIAATLLSGGWTAHSVFKLPLNLASEETLTCNISKNSARGSLLQQCKLIVWDECTLSHKRAIEALDRCLQDIQKN